MRKFADKLNVCWKRIVKDNSEIMDWINKWLNCHLLISGIMWEVNIGVDWKLKALLWIYWD